MRKYTFEKPVSESSGAFSSHPDYQKNIKFIVEKLKDINLADDLKYNFSGSDVNRSGLKNANIIYFAYKLNNINRGYIVELNKDFEEFIKETGAFVEFALKNNLMNLKTKMDKDNGQLNF